MISILKNGKCNICIQYIKTYSLYYGGRKAYYKLGMTQILLLACTKYFYFHVDSDQ